MRRPVFIANWKMNHGPTEARAFMAAFTARWTPREDRTVVFCPPAISLGAVVQALGSRRDIAVGVQNVWTEDAGAFTGETSARMAADAGARYVLVGHSERRHVFGETDAETALKCAAVVRSGLTPILCVGELLSQREAGTTNDVVIAQLSAGFTQLSDASVAKAVIAYEPVWAIGTGKTATPSDASAVHAHLREVLHNRIGERAADVPIVYGGSVNSDNAESLLAANDVDGLLVGGASLDPANWATICSARIAKG
jgi:triosephosphate isomerase (TIM)